MIGFPFDSHVTYDAEGNPIYDRAISSAPYRKLLRELFKTGIMPTDSANMQVAAGEGMSVIVNPGFAMVEGCMKLEEEVTNLSIQASDSALDRIDTVVLRLDSNENVRSCEFAVISGVPSLVPIRPELTRNESVYEIGLADVLVSKTVTVISDSKITDTRFDNERCGVVSSISEFDTTTLNQQMVAWSREQREEFSAWVDSIKDILDESTAGHLQNEIDELRESAGGVRGLIGGEYDSTKTYGVGDVVQYEGSMWKSKIANNRGNTPAEGTYWTASTIASGVSELNQNLTAQDNLQFRFATDGEGNYGYLKADDSFAPFSTKADLLWTNPAPYNQFGAQKVSLNLSKYGAVIIETKDWYASDPASVPHAFGYINNPSNTITRVASPPSSETQGAAARNINKVDNTGIWFGHTYNTGADNRFGTPLRIYGIRKALI